MNGIDEPYLGKHDPPAVCRHGEHGFPEIRFADIPYWGLEFYVRYKQCFQSGPKQQTVHAAIAAWDSQNLK